MVSMRQKPVSMPQTKSMLQISTLMRRTVSSMPQKVNSMRQSTVSMRQKPVSLPETKSMLQISTLMHRTVSSMP